MSSVLSKVAVVGSGISGAACAWSLARNGVSVTLFESGRGPGGRMSQRREIAEDGRELHFDHGAPYFTVSSQEVLSLVRQWESKNLCAEWKESFGIFDCFSNQFTSTEQEGASGRYVGTPGMNSICKALCHEPGVESKFGVNVGRMEWLEKDNSWLLLGIDGQSLGQFEGIVASDKNIVSPRSTSVSGRVPPLDLSLVPDLAIKLQNIPVIPCFALMLAFEQPLSMMPFKGFSIKNSKVLSWAYCDSSKPGRSTACERWILHSTKEYAERVIAEYGLQKPSDSTLKKVAEELYQELQSLGLCTPRPFFMKAHRWGSAFPAASIAGEEKCFWDESKRVAICGDFCVSPNIEGAILSGLAAASKFQKIVSSL
ncbi:uncharacterized protein LOC103492994 [Cucumis melo]|uniref:Uncharacterized protein LOC103492994 n=1 Tax=Cucumis melo TaxID=3656 RepID=A0A1S3BSG0_CUCME|nr:uncharacterized protein LOC103492994 [Cucumis melo]